MDALALRRLHRLGRAQNIIAAGAREAGNHRAANALRNALHALEIANARNRKAGFNDIDPKLGQCLGHAQFFIEIHRKTGRLLAITQSGIEYDDAIVGNHAEIRMVDAHGGSRFGAGFQAFELWLPCARRVSARNYAQG